ncbi:hypothetical protein [Nocardia sp. NPDC003345]
MTVRLAVSDGPTGVPPTPRKSSIRRRPLRSRIVVVTPSAADAVLRLGGWLFDRTTAGWETVALTADGDGSRALEIVGARVLDLETALGRPGWTADIDELAVSAELYSADLRVRDLVRTRVDRGTEHTYLWGGTSAEPHGDAVLTRHRVSLAGLAFKRRALEAAGTADGPGAGEELFWPAGLRR